MYHFFGQLSLLHGWLPPTLQGLAVIVLITVIEWRMQRWLRRVLPAALVAAVAVTLLAYRYITSLGVAGDPAPASLIALGGLAAVLLLAGRAAAGGVAAWRRCRCRCARCAPPWP